MAKVGPHLVPFLDDSKMDEIALFVLRCDPESETRICCDESFVGTDAPMERAVVDLGLKTLDWIFWKLDVGCDRAELMDGRGCTRSRILSCNCLRMIYISVDLPSMKWLI